jgi:hypothetical protein
MKREQPSAFQYFLSGAVASTGINIITGVIVAPSRTLDALLMSLVGVGVILIAYLMSRRATIYDHFEKLVIAATPAALSKEEREAIQDEHNVRRDGEARSLVLPIAIVAIMTIAIVGLREYLLSLHH